jgi:5'/3'-nucleotidase
MDRPLILLTNDDGIEAPGLAALRAAADPLGRVVVVAPDRERSGAGHALTLMRPLRVVPRGPDRYQVDGTPTDCVHLGVFNLTGGRAPDLVLSGINRGLNVGDDVTYSGTVAAALEATLLGIPAIAFSSERDAEGNAHFGAAARLVATLVARVLDRRLPSGVFLNVNVPLGVPRGVRITRQGTRSYRAAAIERLDPSGRPYYWIASPDTTPFGEPDGDHEAIREGWTSITPLQANLTYEPAFPDLASWTAELS